MNTSKYGNLVSSIYAQTAAKPDATIGTDATILIGRDREPARVVDIKRSKSGAIRSYVLQAFAWTMDDKSEGYASAIHWDKPVGEPQEFKVRRNGTIDGAMIGAARAFYDRSF